MSNPLALKVGYKSHISCFPSLNVHSIIIDYMGKNCLNCHKCLDLAQSSILFVVSFVVFLLLFGGCSKAKHGHRCGERSRSDPSRGLEGDTARHVDLHSGRIQAHRRPGRYTTLHNYLNAHVLYICIHVLYTQINK